jgi:organic hydroperoxide reductase OsmC/OhrA
MAEHKAIIHWERRANDDFAKGKYSREHTWEFDGGFKVPASSSPSVVPTPWSNPANVDPEEAFVAAASSCHMLSFVWEAYRKGFVVESYHDEAIGQMSKNEKGKFWVSSITLNPKVTFSGPKIPTTAEEEELHHLAHQECYIANSIKTEVVVGTMAHA